MELVSTNSRNSLLSFRKRRSSRVTSGRQPDSSPVSISPEKSGGKHSGISRVSCENFLPS